MTKSWHKLTYLGLALLATAPLLGGASITQTHLNVTVQAKCRRPQQKSCLVSHKRTAQAIFSTYYRHYHMRRTQAAGLTGLAVKESNLKPAARGGVDGYGLYQITGVKLLRRWCQKHRLNYWTPQAQCEYYYQKFVKPSSYLRTHGSVAHEAKEAELRVERCAVPDIKQVEGYARQANRILH